MFQKLTFRRRHIQLLSAAVVAVLFIQCSSTPQPVEDEEPQFIGAPPTDEDDDPLFRYALPAEAVPADATGRIGAPSTDPPVVEDIDKPRVVDEPQVIEEPEIAEEIDEPEAIDAPELAEEIDEPEAVDEPELAEEIDEPEAVDEPELAEEIDEDIVEQAVVEEPPIEEIEAPPQMVDEKEACFSCVRICPIDDLGNATCTEGSEDLICGWGSHENREDARRTARAHCDSSLDMARHMPNYSRIDGECPPATCR